MTQSTSIALSRKSTLNTSTKRLVRNSFLRKTVNNLRKTIPGYRFVETKDEDGNTIHYYEQVITKHLEVGTNKELAPQEDGQQPKKDIEGYEFVETKDDNGDTIHFYKPVKKVYTKHIDKSTGKELAPQEDGKQPKREFDGYKFVETKDEDGNTIHYYEPIAKSDY